MDSDCKKCAAQVSLATSVVAASYVLVRYCHEFLENLEKY